MSCSADRVADARAPVMPRRAAVLAQAAVPICAAATTFASLSGGPGRVTGQVVLLALLCAAWLGVVRRKQGDWRDVVALLAVVGTGAGLAVLGGGAQVYVAGYASLFVAPFFYEGLAAIPVAAAAMLAVGLSATFVGTFDPIGGAVTGVGAGCFGLAARFWGRVMRTSVRNAELVEELEESRAEQARGAVLAERARLSRELHDVLAHTLSGLALHLESTRVLADARDVDPTVRAGIATAARLARAGLDEARRAVGALRDDADTGPAPGPEAVTALVDEFRRTTGIACTLHVTGAPRELPAQAGTAVFRCVQEALTNVGKHAPASTVDVWLDWRADAVAVEVANRVAVAVGAAAPVGDGTRPGARGGAGLVGMRERAELVGADLDAGRTPDGFRVRLTVPL